MKSEEGGNEESEKERKVRGKQKPRNKKEKRAARKEHGIKKEDSKNECKK